MCEMERFGMVLLNFDWFPLLPDWRGRWLFPKKSTSVGWVWSSGSQTSSQVVISGSGRVSISGSIWASGAAFIPRSCRARDLVTIAEVGSGRVPSLGRVTTGVGSASRGAETRKLNSLGTSSRPSWLGLSVSIALLSNTGISTLEIPKYSGADSLFTANSVSTTIPRETRFTNRIWRDGRRSKAKQSFPAFFNGTWQQTTATARAHNPEALGVENFSTPQARFREGYREILTSHVRQANCPMRSCSTMLKRCPNDVWRCPSTRTTKMTTFHFWRI